MSGGEYVNAERLMELAWENLMLTEPDCAMLYAMIKQAQEEELLKER